MQSETVDAKGVSRLQNLFLTLDKALQVRRLFSEGHKSSVQATESSFAALSEYLREHGNLTVKIEKDTFLVGAESVYRPSEDRENLPHKLFHDGIVEVGFSPGLQREEYENFLQILEFNLESEDEVFDDDRATLMWEAAFQHIHYTLVQEGGDDEIGLWEGGAQLQERVEDLFGVTCSPTELMHRQQELIQKSLRVGHSDESSFEGDLAPFLSLSSEEMGEMMRKLGPVSHRGMLVKFVEILFDCIGERGGLQLNELRVVLWRIILPLYERGKFEWLVETLQEISALSRSVGHEQAGELLWIFEQLEDEERISQLSHFVRSTPPEGQQALYRYILLLRDRAIPSLMELLAGLHKDEKTLLRKAITRKCAVNSRPLIDCLKRGNIDLIKESLLLMDKLGDERFIDPLGKLAEHEDPRIQKLAITCLSHYDSPKAAHAILPALDNDNRAIRFFAINRLRNYRHNRLIETIKEKIGTPAFHSYPWEEKEKICGLLASIGGRKVIPFFDQMLQDGWREHRWYHFFRSATEAELDLRRAGLRALGRIQRAESRAIIEREAQRKDSVGEEAEQILTSLERGGDG